MAYKNILLQIDGPVAHLTINRPEAMNALNEAVLLEIEDALYGQLATNPSIRALVLAGAGEKAFIAGADIGAMAKMGSQEALQFARRGQALTRGLETLPFITIAKVQGFALGGGCEFAMACDITVASTKAKFGQPEVNLGIITGFGGTQRLLQRVGMAVGLDMLCAGRNLSGEEALQYGLVARCVAPEQLDAEVNIVVKGVLRAGPMAVAETKRLARESYGMSLDAGLGAEATAFAARFGQEEAREGLHAFVEKRRANFSS